tara:strand:+ start:361 stop:492 length:132 start_codon:yes stop_codon:yes gene_type:complete
MAVNYGTGESKFSDGSSRLVNTLDKKKRRVAKRKKRSYNKKKK